MTNHEINATRHRSCKLSVYFLKIWKIRDSADETTDFPHEGIINFAIIASNLSNPHHGTVPALQLRCLSMILFKIKKENFTTPS